LLKRTIQNLSSNGASFKAIVMLVSQKFNIGEKMARDIVTWRRKEDVLMYGIRGMSEQTEEIKLPSPDEVKRIENPRKDGDCKIDHQEVKLALWESKSVAIKHSYTEEVFQNLLDDEISQVTPWHVVREGAALLDTFAPIRYKCIECIINFSVKYRLQQKTTESAFVYLYRFLLLPKATSVVQPGCGVRGASGAHSLLAVSLCILMISAKYEEIYPPALHAFAGLAHSSVHEFGILETRILHIMK